MTMTAQALPERHEINPEDTWDISSIYASDEAWEADFAKIEAGLPELQALAGTLREGPQALLKVFQAQESLWIVAEQVLAYAYLRGDEDTTNARYQAMRERSNTLAAKASAAGAWIDPELLTLSDEELRGYLGSEPALAVYGRAIEELIRMRPHVRSAEVEELLAQAREATRGPGSIFNMFNDADLKFEPVTDADGNQLELTHGRYIRLLENADREVRRQAFTNLHRQYFKFRNTLASTYAANVRGDIFYARAHGYESSVDAALKPHDIPLSVYENLIATVHEHLPTFHRYLRIRKRILGLDDLHFYDLFTPLSKGVQRKISFDDAATLVLQSTAPLGAEYTGALGNGLESRWIDKYENRGKRSGAYSGGAFTSQPFVLMNYQDNLNSLFTLAHELGHSMHS
ncbi:MAG TPA: M3 family oligoendopeptidase, partial [Herpetosiphonaceae bacterium]